MPAYLILYSTEEPIVNTPQEAINCFLQTNIDILVIEGYCIKKKTYAE
ncbi:carbamoyltransferase C-terminal domain-containing protein [Mucilaginibacter sp. R-33]